MLHFYNLYEIEIFSVIIIAIYGLHLGDIVKCYEEIGGDAMLTRKREVLSQRDDAESDEEFDIDIDKRQRFRPYDRGNNKEFVSESVSVPRRGRDVYGDCFLYYELMKLMFAEKLCMPKVIFRKYILTSFLLFER